MKRHSIVFGMLILVHVFSDELVAQDVDPMTGRAIINIPLGEISAKDMSASVSLSHHGGALRFEEGAGNAGVGWSVVAGGSVSREVRGLPDDFNQVGDSRKGWLHNTNAQVVQSFTPSADDALAVCSDELTDWTFLNGRGYVYDTEPDIYYFQAPGVSGKFIFGTDGLPKLIPYQDLQINAAGAAGGSIGSFTIKTNTGLTYLFDIKEEVTRQSQRFALTQTTLAAIDYFRTDYNYYVNPLTYNTTWNLSSIQSAATGTTVNFLYNDGESSIQSRYYSGIKGTTQQVDTLFSIRDLYKPKLLTQITLMSYSISLSWANEVIDKITIAESETGDMKEFDLVYKMIKSTFGSGYRKPFLHEIKQQNSCIPYPAYRFSYYDVDTAALTINVPWKWERGGRDHFGYYNGRFMNKNIPTVYYYANETGARRFRVTPIPSGATLTQTFSGVSGEHMNVDVNNCKVGALWQIRYPNGGQTVINYEGNKYLDATTNEQLWGPGIRVSSITSAGGDFAYAKPHSTNPQWHALTKTYQYLATDNTTTSGRMLYPPVFAYTDGVNFYRTTTNQSPGSEVLYGRVKEIIAGFGYREYIYDLFKTYPDATSDATPSKIARPSGTCTLLSNAKNGPYTYPFAPITDNSYKSGFLTKVTEYSEAGLPTLIKRIVYTMPQASSTIKGVRFESIDVGAPAKTIFYYSSYNIPINQSRILSQERVTTYPDNSQTDTTYATTAYQYNTKNMVTKVTKTNDDNSILEENFKYAMDYAVPSPASTDTLACAIFELIADNRQAQIIETYQRVTPAQGSATVVGAQLNMLGKGTFVLPYKQKHLPSGAVFTPSSVAGTPQTITTDGDYITDVKIDYSNGLPVSSIGISKIRSSTHYSISSGLPVANFVNCKPKNALYAGFEMSTGRGLVSTGTGPSSAVEVWTGKYSQTLTSAYQLNSDSITKNGTSYRVSIWAYAVSGNINLTIRARNSSGVDQGTPLTLNYPTASANKWAYLEGFLDVSAVSTSNFTLRITTSATIKLDDFVAIPKAATISFNTLLPFTGVTSQTDDRGNSTVVQYDAMGRKMNVLDNKRNFIELTEYGSQKQGKVVLSANFTSTVTSYFKGQAVNFQAAPSCVSGLTYEWTFKDFDGNETTATGNPVSKTFTKFGAHVATLTVSKAGYESVSYTDYVCINPDVLTASISVTPDAEWKQCDVMNRREKTFIATISWSNPGLQVIYEWYAKDGSGTWHVLSPSTLLWANVISINGNQLVYNSPPYTYDVKCVISIQPFSDLHYLDCPFSSAVAEATKTITYTNNQPCP
jgi:hypothetical protein